MNNDLSLFIILSLIMPSVPVTCLAGLALILAVVPRTYTRRLRHKLAGFVLWQWVKGSKLSSIVHGWLWQEGNGKTHGGPK